MDFLFNTGKSISFEFSVGSQSPEPERKDNGILVSYAVPLLNGIPAIIGQIKEED